MKNQDLYTRSLVSSNETFALFDGKKKDFFFICIRKSVKEKSYFLDINICYGQERLMLPST